MRYVAAAARRSRERCRARDVKLGAAAVAIFLLFATGIPLTALGVFELYIRCALSHEQCPRASLDWQVRQPEASQTDRIPHIIHQQWKDENNIPEHWQAPSQSWKDLHPNFTYIMWNDTMCRDFIAKEHAWFLPTYDSYPHNIQRFDSVRYFILYTHGGIYSDMDIGAERHVGDLLKYDAVIPVTKPVGLTNSLMLSIPKHPFFEKIVKHLPDYNRNFILPYSTVMFSTGPMYLTAQYSVYRNNDVVVLPRRQFDGQDAFFFTVAGSSWHKWDAVFFLFSWKHPGLVLFMLLLVAFAATLYHSLPLVFWGRGHNHHHLHHQQRKRASADREFEV
eukprot:jgi/Chlat1/8895/Chrsp92S08208